MKDKKKSNKTHNVKKKQLVDDLKQQPCFDCKGIFPAYVMEFDHREARNGKPTVAALISKLGIDRLREEIAKCDIVCANCHRIRTHKRRTMQSRLTAGYEALNLADLGSNPSSAILQQGGSA